MVGGDFQDIGAAPCALGRGDLLLPRRTYRVDGPARAWAGLSATARPGYPVEWAGTRVGGAIKLAVRRYVVEMLARVGGVRDGAGGRVGRAYEMPARGWGKGRACSHSAARVGDARARVGQGSACARAMNC